MFPASAVAKIPGALTFAEGATFPCAGVTAWHRHVVETVGAATLEQSLKACARGGCVTLVGVVSGRAATADASLIQSHELTLRSIYVGPLTMLRDAMQAFAGHGVRPPDRSFGFGDAPAAFDHLRNARHTGKVVIEQ